MALAISTRCDVFVIQCRDMDAVSEIRLGKVIVSFEGIRADRAAHTGMADDGLSASQLRQRYGMAHPAPSLKALQQ